MVIGILIALQINNWSEANKEQKILNEYLIKIKSHTLDDLRQLDTISSARKQLSRICKQARDAMLNKTEEENLYIMMASGIAFVDYYFKPKTDGYESLKNSSSFGKINNTVLDSLLIQYHSLIKDIAENEKSYNEYVLDQEAYLSSRFDRTLIFATAFVSQYTLRKRATPQSEYIETFKAYISTIPYRNVIGLAAFQYDLVIEQYDQLTKAGEGVIAEIDKITND